LIRQAQAGFKVFLDREANPLHFSLIKSGQLHPIATIGDKFSASRIPSIPFAVGSTNCYVPDIAGEINGSGSMTKANG
jgi:hypothetical protein